MSEGESVCFIPEGQEASVAFALGGQFKLEEDCGPFGSCNHKVEKFDYRNGQTSYAQWYYCSTNYYTIGGLLVGIIAVFFVLAYVVKRLRKKNYVAEEA